MKSKKSLTLKQQCRKERKQLRAKKKAINKKFYQSWEWKEVRYRVLLRDGRQCICCGAKAPEIKIVVDHIKPRSRFPELELDEGNLQVLCDSCNRGKSNKDYTDFRSLGISQEILDDDEFWKRNL